MGTPILFHVKHFENKPQKVSRETFDGDSMSYLAFPLALNQFWG